MTENTPTVAVLGTGIMGAAMARSIARAGLPTRAWNRTRAKADPLVADGITVTDTVAEAVTDADIVLTMLYDAAAVRAVMAEAVDALRPGAAWLQSTTIGVEDVAGLAASAAEHGWIFFDAPVSGTRAPAEAGKLLVLAAGPVVARPVVAPVLEAIGARTLWTGEDGAVAPSTRLKLVVNSWVLAANNAAGEVVALARALGVDPARFFDVIGGGGLDLGYLRLKSGLILEGKLSPASFAVATAAKDAHLIVAVAREHGLQLDGAEAYEARLDRAIEAGHGSADMAAAYVASFPEAERRRP